MNDIGERLDFYRRNKGYSLKEVADVLGLTEGAIRNAIKRNSIKLSHINVICDNYDVSKDWLLYGTGEMEVIKNEKTSISIEDLKDKNISILERWNKSLLDEIEYLKDRLKRFEE